MGNFVRFIAIGRVGVDKVAAVKPKTVPHTTRLAFTVHNVESEHEVFIFRQTLANRNGARPLAADCYCLTGLVVKVESRDHFAVFGGCDFF